MMSLLNTTNGLSPGIIRTQKKKKKNVRGYLMVVMSIFGSSLILGKDLENFRTNKEGHVQTLNGDFLNPGYCL